MFATGPLEWTICTIFCPSRRLADHDVVVTTYSLVSKEIPVQKEDAEKPNKDSDDVVRKAWLQHPSLI